MEIDPSVVASRVSMRGADESLPLSEQARTSSIPGAAIWQRSERESRVS